jgi:hypothetical protein
VIARRGSVTLQAYASDEDGGQDDGATTSYLAIEFGRAEPPAVRQDALIGGITGLLGGGAIAAGLAWLGAGARPRHRAPAGTLAAAGLLGLTPATVFVLGQTVYAYAVLPTETPPTAL